MPRPEMPKPIKAKIIALGKRGLSLREIKERTGYSIQHVCFTLKNAGVTIGAKVRAAHRHRKVHELVNSTGGNFREIAVVAKISRTHAGNLAKLPLKEAHRAR